MMLSCLPVDRYRANLASVGLLFIAETRVIALIKVA